MEYEDTMLLNQAEAEETSDAFDEGWDDDTDGSTGIDGYQESDESDNAWDNDEDSEETEADADKQDADGTEGEGTDGDASKGEAEGDEGNPDQGETFALRYLGEERSVNREEVISLAQQGMDYGRIREKWDAVKDDVPKYRMYESFLKELADMQYGGDVEALIDNVRIRSLMNMAKAGGKEMNAAEAARQAMQTRLKSMEADEAKLQEAREEEARLQRRAAVDRFMMMYPGVKYADISQDVWAESEKIGDLTVPYQKQLIGKLEEENKRLTRELEQAKQQQNNKARSMGTSRSVGSAATRDPFDEGWDEA